jgi:hypothetical protein
MKATLIVLKDNLVLVNDDKIEKGWFITKDFVLYNINKDNELNIGDGDKKVIAKSPNIKLSSQLSEKIGYVGEDNIIVMAQQYALDKCQDNMSALTKVKNAVEYGFEKAQELNKNKYSIDDIIRAFEAGEFNQANIKYPSITPEEYIQSLQQPKSYQVTYTEDNGIFNVTE